MRYDGYSAITVTNTAGLSSAHTCHEDAQGVKVDGIALFQNQLFILEEYLYFPLQYQIEFLAAVSNQSGLFNHLASAEPERAAGFYEVKRKAKSSKS